jgi:SAM-dependent methyltransferase
MTSTKTDRLRNDQAQDSPRTVTATQCAGCGSHGATRLLESPDRYHGRTIEYRLLRCPSCSLVWLDNAPPPSEIGKHYGPDYDRSVAAAGDEPGRWSERWKTIRSLRSGGSLLDLGCSAGGFLSGMRGPDWKLHGIEMSEEVAAKARARTGADIFVGDILDAPFPPESFDLITCFHVFEHIYYPREVLEKVSRWLKPGGLFYVMVPNIDSAGARIFKSHWYALELPRHLFHYSPKSLRTLAAAAGLEDQSVTTHREVFIEQSCTYLLNTALSRIGVQRTPPAVAPGPGIPFRVVRKLFRLSALPILNLMASAAGPGESIHAIFRKA